MHAHPYSFVFFVGAAVRRRSAGAKYISTRENSEATNAKRGTISAQKKTNSYIVAWRAYVKQRREVSENLFYVFWPIYFRNALGGLNGPLLTPQKSRNPTSRDDLRIVRFSKSYKQGRKRDGACGSEKISFGLNV